MHNPLAPGAKRYIIQRFTLLALFGGLFFSFAGDWLWLRGWAFLGAVAVAEALSLAALAALAPAMLNQRGTPHAKIAWFDRLFILLWLTLSLATPIIAGLAVRRGAPQMSWTSFFIGLGLLGAASPLATWAMIVNEHFEQFVRIQHERGHRAVTAGPYRLVRHPGYLAAIIGALAAPLLLGVACAFIPSLLVGLLFAWRTSLEDCFLLRHLPGYREYAGRTLYRLFPGLW